MLQLDHIVVSAHTLEEGRAYVEASLGVGVQAGGKHALFGTHNMLLGLADRVYLEIIAVDPDAPDPERARMFDLDRFAGAPRLSNWVCRSDALEADMARAFGPDLAPLALQRGDLSWRMGMPGDGTLPFDNLFPAMIDWGQGPVAADRLAPSGCRLTRLVIGHPDSAGFSASLDGLLSDDRIAIEQSEAPMMTAIFDTPNGEVILQ
ncbi:VOC family protein [Thalassovita sp.]|uniref:VOC family protein n=1 Tax=Thalassovita sp. TaxID=1979401 RepID=UPI002B2680D5|nr:VOC family protein [Thalassovita sp.]